MTVIVDGNNALIRSFFAYPDLRSPSGAPTGAVFGVASRVRELIDRYAPSAVVVAWDGGRSAWRRAVYAEYKSRKRPAGSLDLTECFAQRPLICELLDALGVGQVAVGGVEADDLIAALALEMSDRGDAAVIASTDRDFYQLVTERVDVYDGAGRVARNVTLATFDAVVGKSSPAEWHAYRIVNGDASDAVPRVHGLSGEKRWQTVYPVLCSMGYEGDAVSFFLEQDAPGPGPAVATEQAAVGIWMQVCENWLLLCRNVLLMDLRFAVTMLPAPVRGKVMSAVTWGKWDAREAERTVARLNFQSAVREWSSWARAFGTLDEAIPF